MLKGDQSLFANFLNTIVKNEAIVNEIIFSIY